MDWIWIRRGYLLQCLFFFFQAEDGIRDLVRSRGLGDVYKRQMEYPSRLVTVALPRHPEVRAHKRVYARLQRAMAPVSYTHLTLPTSDLV